MVISVSPSAYATVKRMQSRPSGMTLLSTPLAPVRRKRAGGAGRSLLCAGGVQVE
jgi:hypothetical protein